MTSPAPWYLLTLPGTSSCAQHAQSRSTCRRSTAHTASPCHIRRHCVDRMLTCRTDLGGDSVLPMRLSFCRWYTLSRGTGRGCALCASVVAGLSLCRSFSDPALCRASLGYHRRARSCGRRPIVRSLSEMIRVAETANCTQKPGVFHF